MAKRRRQPPKRPQTLKRQRLDAPKLRSNACKEFLKYSTSDYNETSNETVNFPVRYSIISEKFRTEVKQVKDIYMEIPVLLSAVNDDHVGSKDPADFFVVKMEKTKEKLDALLNLLKLVEYPSVELVFEKYYYTELEFGKELIKNYAYFCRKLKDIESLKKISVDLVTYDNIAQSTTTLFTSLLPRNKEMQLNSSYDISPLFNRDEKPLESMSIHDLRFDKCTAQMFKINAKELYFSTKHCSSTVIPKLHHLRVVGPFSPNPTLQLLGIDVDLMYSEFGPNFEDSESEAIKKPLWTKEFLPNHRKAFEYLKQINGNLMLDLETNEDASVNDNRKTIPFYKEQLNRAKQIIDIAQEFGFKIKDFCINTVFSLPFGISETDIAQKFTKSTKMKVAKKGEDEKEDENINHLEHNGVQIKLKIFFPKRVQICCMRASRVIMPIIELSDDEERD